MGITIRYRRYIYVVLTAFGFMLFCSKIYAGETKGLSLTSPDFNQGGFIPSLYTCDGKNVNPQLIIHNVPGKTKSLVLIVEDPDAPAGLWIHWLMWNIDPDVRVIKENSVPSGAIQGMNDFKNYGYGGPCPPWGTHRYFFKLFALDTKLSMSSKASKDDIEKAMKSHVIAKTELMGLYRRK
ncbi:MAG: YbhB/YbcL family Raf kinase inhibitor-like protein [bacterium]